jgi:muramoyltetrapeptide carboxypeptidase
MILMTDLIGTPEQIDMKDKIVLIEDVDEPPHRVDAMLTHLINSGSLPQAAGIVIAEMTRTDTPERLDKGIGGKPWRVIVEDRVKPLGIPTVVHYPFGHVSNMLSMPMGIHADFDADAGTLTYTEYLCEPH